jgi:hypothetical protein
VAVSAFRFSAFLCFLWLSRLLSRLGFCLFLLCFLWLSRLFLLFVAVSAFLGFCSAFSLIVIILALLGAIGALMPGLAPKSFIPGSFL